MTTVGVTMVRDEDDVVEHTVRHMLEQCDAVIVADNMSTDSTRDILSRLAIEYNGMFEGPPGHPLVSRQRLLVVDDLEPAYRQSAKMTALAHRAHDEFGADWIVPFDADEWWYSTWFPTLSEALSDIPDWWNVVKAELWDHVTTDLDDPAETNPVKRICWRRTTPVPLPKVACRWAPDLLIEQGNHGAHYTDSTAFVMPPAALTVRHFPYRSAEQFVRKARNGAAAYAAGPDIPADFGVHWREWGALLAAHGEAALVDVYRHWYHAEGRVAEATLLYDPAPQRP